MDILTIFIAGALLLFGRQLYWLFVGALGFLVGSRYAPILLEGQPEWAVLLAAVGVGLIGALLAIFLQRVALVLAGFLAGGFLISRFAVAFGMSESMVLFAFVVGGILAAILVLLFLDPGLIALSSLVGAAVLARALPLEPLWMAIAFVAIFVVGAVVQGAIWMGIRRRSTAPPT